MRKGARSSVRRDEWTFSPLACAMPRRKRACSPWLLSWLLVLVVGLVVRLPTWRATFRGGEGSNAPRRPAQRRCPTPRRSNPQGLAGSQRNVVVLLPGVLDGLVAQHVERAADAPARGARQDHLVDIAALGGDERIGEAVLVLLDARWRSSRGRRARRDRGSPPRPSAPSRRSRPSARRS